jgi:hypothetical protein
MELGTREGPKDFLAGLDRCVEKDSTISATEKKTWELIKANGRRLFDPAFGGRYEIFNERPVPQAIAIYCAGDVTLLPDLFKVYLLSSIDPERHCGSTMYWKQPWSGYGCHKVRDSMEYREAAPAGLGIESLLKKRLMNGMTIF